MACHFTLPLAPFLVLLPKRPVKEPFLLHPSQLSLPHLSLPLFSLPHLSRPLELHSSVHRHVVCGRCCKMFRLQSPFLTVSRLFFLTVPVHLPPKLFLCISSVHFLDLAFQTATNSEHSFCLLLFSNLFLALKA